VHSALEQLLATHRVRMLEALAEAVARMLLDRFGAQWVRVAVTKPRKYDNVAAVGVMIERRARQPTA
jgi:dihydroneopterin aldolase